MCGSDRKVLDEIFSRGEAHPLLTPTPPQGAPGRGLLETDRGGGAAHRQKSDAAGLAPCQKSGGVRGLAPVRWRHWSGGCQ